MMLIESLRRPESQLYGVAMKPHLSLSQSDVWDILQCKSPYKALIGIEDTIALAYEQQPIPYNLISDWEKKGYFGYPGEDVIERFIQREGATQETFFGSLEAPH